MGAGLYQYPSVSHRAVDADFERFHYHWVYAAAEKDVVINGETVTMTKDLVLPINVRNNNIQAAPGGNLNNIYLLGNIRAEDISLDISALTEASQRGTLFLWTQGGRENLVSDGAVEFNSSNDDHLEHPDDPDLEPGSEHFHVGGWVYFSDLSGDGALLSKLNLDTDEVEFMLNYLDSNEVFRITVSSDGTASNVVLLEASSFGSPSINTWYFVDGKWDGSNIYIRVNDGVEDVMAFSGPLYEGNALFRLGGYAGGGGLFSINGRLDSTFFYKGGTLTDQEITFLYNSGNGRTYAEVSQHPTLGTKFDGTSGYWWNLDEVSGTRFDATGGGKDLTPVNSPSLAQGVVAGQPSTEQAALSKWEDDSGKSHDPVQSTGTNKGFTWIDTDGKMYVEFGGDDHFEVGGTAQEWEDFLKGDFFGCLLLQYNLSSSINAIMGGNESSFDNNIVIDKVDNNDLRLYFSSDGQRESVRIEASNIPLQDGEFFLFSFVKRMSNSFDLKINDLNLPIVNPFNENPDHSLFSLSGNKPFIGARNNGGNPQRFYQGRMKEKVLCNDLSRFDNIRKELLQKHNL